MEFFNLATSFFAITPSKTFVEWFDMVELALILGIPLGLMFVRIERRLTRIETKLEILTKGKKKCRQT